MCLPPSCLCGSTLGFLLTCLKWLELETFDDDELTLLYPEDEPSVVHACATLPSAYSTSSPSDSELSLPSSPSTDDAGDASFAPRLSHGRRKKDGHIPRPPNAFMIFRSFLWDQMKHDPKGPRDHREISKSAGREWGLLSKQQRKPYEEKAKAKKAEHEKMYPGYRYAPMSKREVKKRRIVRDTQAEAELCRDAVDMVMRRTFRTESKAPRAEIKAPETATASVPSKSLYRKPAHASCLPTPPSRPHRRLQGSSSTLRTSVELSVEQRGNVGLNLPLARLEHEPELVAPCSTSDDLNIDGYVPTAEIPHLDLSVSVSGFESTASYVRGSYSYASTHSNAPHQAPSTGVPPDTSFLFSNFIDFSAYPMAEPDPNLPVHEGPVFTSPAGSPDDLEYAIAYPDNGSDATESPTSGLLSSSPTWSFEMNNWILSGLDSQFPSCF